VNVVVLALAKEPVVMRVLLIAGGSVVVIVVELTTVCNVDVVLAKLVVVVVYGLLFQRGIDRFNFLIDCLLGSVFQLFKPKREVGIAPYCFCGIEVKLTKLRL
jgi:hypothetical protein